MAKRDVETAAALFIAALAATVMAQTAPSGGPSRALLRYDFVRGGHVIGHLTVNGDDSARTARFDGDDGGRSWGFDESARLDRDGIPTSVTVIGTNLSGQPVRDQYQ